MRLIDCFIELLAYTSFAMKEADQGRLEFEPFKKEVERLLDQGGEMKAAGGFAEDDYDAARFAVCAWVDESVLCSRWKDKELWEHQQLQRVYYDTTNAGEEFFRRLDAVPDDNKDLLELYGACLYLGFSGRYYAVRSRLELEAEGRRIREKVLGGMEDPFRAEENKFFPAGYLDPKERAKKRFFSLGAVPAVLGWGAMAAGLVLGLYLYMNFYLDNLVAVFFK